jgi:serine/threonine protein kinase
MVGQTLSHFKITAKLGEGGMGEVYLATDTKLGREVAIKVLPEEFTADEERLARFEREARMLAALDHSNIAAIYGLEKAEGRNLLVMQLAERITRGPIPVDEAIPIALQIAEALETAHEKGIIHRDLKPANVKVTQDGQVKVLDFGLAKALELEPTSEGEQLLTQSPTLTAQMTGAGVLLGTAAYMSPEQADGQEADRRSDIWSFGTVLFEMLTGRKPFTADTAPRMIAAVLNQEVDWRRLPRRTPRSIRHLLERCLEKEPKLRLQAIGEARITIQRYLDDPAGSPRPTAGLLTPSSAKTWAALLTGALTVAALAALAGWKLRPETPSPPLRRFELDVGSVETGRMFHPQISPDGASVLYGHHAKLWVRRLSELTSREIPGSLLATYACWSPDSRSVAFATGGRLWKVHIDGDRPFPVAPFPQGVVGGGGMVWLGDGRIVLAGGPVPLLQVPANGGRFETLLESDEELADFHELGLMPDGRTILFVAHRLDPEGRRRLVDSLGVYADGRRQEILRLEGEIFSSVAYSPSGHLLFHRGTGSAGLWAVEFDAGRLAVTGPPFLVAPEVRKPSVAADGTLLMVQGLSPPQRELVRVDRRGVVQWASGQLLPGMLSPALSKDATKVAVTATEGDNSEIWAYDLELATRSRLTFTPTVEMFAGWSPIENRLVLEVGDARQLAMLDGGGGELQMLVSGSQPAWSPDGRSLVYTRFMPEGGTDLHRLLLDGSEPERLTATEALEFSPRFSPDGRVLAYASDESGRFEVYVEGFPRGGGGRRQVSRDGGEWPDWSADGREIFFVGSTDGLLMAVPVLEREPLVLGTPEPLFSVPELRLVPAPRPFAASADGDFYMARDVDRPDERGRLVLVQNWSAEFEGPAR